MNGLYLHLLVNELRAVIMDKIVDAVLIRDRLVQLALGQQSLFFSLYADAPAILLAPRIGQDFEKLASFNDLLAGCAIVDLVQSGLAPAARLILEKTVYGELHTTELTVSLYRDGPNLRIRTNGLQRQLFKRFIERPPRKPLAEARSDAAILDWSEYEGVDRGLAKELAESPEHLGVLQRALDGAPYAPRLVSVMPLKVSIFEHPGAPIYGSLNALMAAWLEMFLKDQGVTEARVDKTLRINKLRRKIEHLKKALAAEDEIEMHRIHGELILANLKLVKKGMTGVSLFSHYAQKNVRITLDPSKDGPANARDYFSRYKKQKRGMPKIRQQIADLEQEIDRLERGTAAVETAGARVKDRAVEKRSPFREYALISGSMVYVGKSARSNDQLTFKFARPDDYFFHARGVEGAHVLLKANTRKGQKPSSRDLQAAASIAAYFSKAKTQKKVPVSYIQKKYLKKNKKAKPGSVILMREEVIFVDPGLPL